MAELFSVSFVLGLLGLLLVVLAVRGRWKRGLGHGETVALDDVTLFSERLKLTGRPDRIVKRGKTFIPEEWKSAKRVTDGHKLQHGRAEMIGGSAGQRPVGWRPTCEIADSSRVFR
jgi:CRISPR-associated exonuclease Cas4